MKIAIFGSEGLLGSKLIKFGSRKFEIMGFDKNKSMDANEYDNIQLDATRREDVINHLKKFKPGVVINAINVPSVDFCEKNKNEARKLIVDTNRNIIDACGDTAKIVFMSSDYVFDGENGPYSENAKPNPINHYAKLKLEGEKMTLDSNKNNLVVRTTILYGNHRLGKPNYVLWALDQLKKKNKISVVTDQFGTPTLADDLAKAILELIDKKKNGIYHVVGKDFVNRFEFTKKIADVFELNSDLIIPITSEQFDQKGIRGRRLGLKTDKMEKDLEIRMSGIGEGLLKIKKEMIRDG